MTEGVMLVLGGARSGKSAFAERVIGASGLQPVYIATAQAGDAEMAERIARHKESRGPGWLTVEEPHELEAALDGNAGEGRAVLVDCLTLWLSNLMLVGAEIEARGRRLCGTVRRLPGRIVLVSNEVGHGLVPDNPLGRRLRDAQGRLNQLVACEAGRVVFMAAGLPLYLKGSP